MKKYSVFYIIIIIIIIFHKGKNYKWKNSIEIE